MVWGGLHGIALAAHRMTTGRTVSSIERHGPPGALRRILGIVVTFHLVCLLWIVFRAESLGAAATFLAGLSGAWVLPPIAWTAPPAIALLCVLALDFSCWWRDAELPIPEAWPPSVQGMIYASLVLGISFIGTSNVRPFIYFQF